MTPQPPPIHAIPLCPLCQGPVTPRTMTTRWLGVPGVLCILFLLTLLITSGATCFAVAEEAVKPDLQEKTRLFVTIMYWACVSFAFVAVGIIFHKRETFLVCQNCQYIAGKVA